MMNASEIQGGALRPCRYLTFKLGDGLYAFPISMVQEIIVLMKIAKVPNASGFVMGCVNLRGRMVPVADLRSKFGMPAAECGSKSSVVVVQIPVWGELSPIGALVDEVCEVVSLSSEQIFPSPAAARPGVERSLLHGVGKLRDGRSVMLLDLEKAFAISDFAALSCAPELRA